MGQVEQVVRRDVHRTHDPLARVAEVEDVHARRRLLEVPEEHPLAREGVGENRAVYATVADREGGVPAVVGDQSLERGQHPVEEFADRLAAQEPGVVRDHAPERVDELALDDVGRDLGQAAAVGMIGLSIAIVVTLVYFQLTLRTERARGQR